MLTIDVADTAGAVSRAECVLTEPVIAAIAVHATTTVAGVVRLEPGLAGLAGSLARSARQRIKGLDPAPTEGVRVEVDREDPAGPCVRLEIDLVTSAQDQAAAVAQAVQRAVTRAVAGATGLALASVSVSILDIDPGAGG
ncbi:Asp23/Gls24 family envelope stress response protein [Amycolatopsis sp. H20-H5]|uniref:Asp23/Gls24 family envelope stress response protein n=1 Tax=Amycolatopsis sp. H20-H5 TaxID=3046309 RepID=UPI002DB8C9BA|nr:Asp23/Gls24 family envelope stress response protein [Amycolatopsis sp. H20-H5]MEC3976166.1 Asp23/Gls24 family envelope stress response protein [Amycolatopsis sp. H20-H5]